MFSGPNSDGETRSAEELFLAVEADLRRAEPGFAWTPDGRSMAERFVLQALSIACFSRATATDIFSTLHEAQARLANTAADLGKYVGVGRDVLTADPTVRKYNLEARILNSIVRVLGNPPNDSVK